MPTVPFRQVDVFAESACRGNPVAVVHLSDGGVRGGDLADSDPSGSDPAGSDPWSTETMQRFARWTNLSETTFLLPPQDPGADYRLRIFTPGGELPFAGHPTLGSAQAWLDAGGEPRAQGVVVQECAAGLIRVRLEADRLAFAAPPLTRSGAPEDQLLEAAARALGITPDEVVAASWVDNGPHWLGVLLRDAETVLGLRPDFAALEALEETEVGVIGPYPAGGAPGAADYEVRAFCPDLGVPEDPVTGSLNAGLAVWLVGAGLAPAAYLVSQGTVLGRAGRVHVTQDSDDLWIGGQAHVLVRGTLDLPA
ncbi:MAG: PhzF family phenazine biosynthesis protein [Actinobacteria bacterium]|nr:PhzF family phenazine biosynthesis protein [Actinomycetota bacterium]